MKSGEVQPSNTGINKGMLTKLLIIVSMMFGFGYAMVPLYNAICEVTGINILALGEKQVPGASSNFEANSQVDTSRTITIEFDANAQGAWFFKPEKTHLTVHPGELATVNYVFQNQHNRTMTAQAIPSYAPKAASSYFNKLECFCFNQYTLKAGEKKEWPVVFVIDPKIPKDITTVTLSYVFFEIGGSGGSDG